MLDKNVLEQQQYVRDLKQTCVVMLKQWSRQILHKWIDVYVRVVPLLRDDPVEKECVDTVLKMTDLQQPISVRLASTYFLAQLAQCQSLSSAEVYKAKILPKVRQLCQDFNWEVRKEICSQMHKIAVYLGNSAELFHELAELVDDEETEVKLAAIKQFSYHIAH